MHQVIIYTILFYYPPQVLMNILSLRINISESLAFGRLHPQLQPNTLLVDGKLVLMIFFCGLAQL